MSFSSAVVVLATYFVSLVLASGYQESPTAQKGVRIASGLIVLVAILGFAGHARAEARQRAELRGACAERDAIQLELEGVRATLEATERAAREERVELETSLESARGQLTDLQNRVAEEAERAALAEQEADDQRQKMLTFQINASRVQTNLEKRLTEEAKRRERAERRAEQQRAEHAELLSRAREEHEKNLRHTELSLGRRMKETIEGLEADLRAIQIGRGTDDERAVADFRGSLKEAEEAAQVVTWRGTLHIAAGPGRPASSQRIVLWHGGVTDDDLVFAQVRVGAGPETDATYRTTQRALAFTPRREIGEVATYLKLRGSLLVGTWSSPGGDFHGSVEFDEFEDARF